MKEAEFQSTYRALQHSVSASDALKEKALAAIFDETPGCGNIHSPFCLSEYPAEARGNSGRRFDTQGSRLPRRFALRNDGGGASSRPTMRTRIVEHIRWWRVTAACLVITALVTGLALNLPGGAGTGTGNRLFTSDFVVRAYASDTNTLLEFGSEGRIIFSRGNASGSNDGLVTEQANAFFTGCLFSVEGEDIIRVQATIGSGELYRHTREEFTAGSDPARLQEVSQWKSTKVGLGTYYNNVDNLDVTALGDQPFDSPAYRYEVDSVKRMGQTIDMAWETSSEKQTFIGLYAPMPEGIDLNDPSLSPEFVFDPAIAAINALDGQELTVTVTFSDGRAATQVLALHAAYMKSEPVYFERNEEQIIGSSILPEIVDTSNMSKEQLFEALCTKREITRSLYGEVIKANSDPFPGSLENANEREFILEKPQIFTDEQLETLLYPNEREPLEAARVHKPGETIEVLSRDELAAMNGNDAPISAFDYTLVDAQRSSRLPEDVPLATSDALTGYQGDLEYMNFISGQGPYGHTVTMEGEISEGASFVTISVDVTNTSRSEQLYYSAGYESLIVGEGESGQYSVAKSHFYDSNRTMEMRQREDRALVFQPGETKRITQVIAVRDEILAMQNLMWLIPAVSAEGATQELVEEVPREYQRYEWTAMANKPQAISLAGLLS